MLQSLAEVVFGSSFPHHVFAIVLEFELVDGHLLVVIGDADGVVVLGPLVWLAWVPAVVQESEVCCGGGSRGVSPCGLVSGEFKP